MCPELDTSRLTLRAHVKGDFGELAAMWADPHVVRRITGIPSTPRESWSRLLRYRGLWPVLGFGYWCVRERQTNRYVGDIGFADFGRGATPSISGVPEAGWVMAAWAHGRGFASEAVVAAFAWLDRDTHHQRTVCLIDNENAASIRIAGKNGFTSAGKVTLDGEDVPLWSRERDCSVPASVSTLREVKPQYSR